MVKSAFPAGKIHAFSGSLYHILREGGSNAVIWCLERGEGREKRELGGDLISPYIVHLIQLHIIKRLQVRTLSDFQTKEKDEKEERWFKSSPNN